MPESTTLQLELEDPACESCGGSARELVISVPDYETRLSNVFDVARCTDCGLVYTAPRPRFDDLLKHFYGSDYLCYSTGGLTRRLRTALQGRAFMRRLRKLMTPEARLLEVGCACGDLLAWVQERSGWELHGCEPQPKAAAVARSRGLRVQDRTLAEAQYDADFFDVVYMSHVLEHVPDVRATMERVFRILRPGGVFITEHPDFDGCTRRWSGRSWWGYHLPRHLTHFTRESIRPMLERSGFLVEGIRGCCRPSLLAWSVENWLKQRRGLRRLTPVLGKRNPAFIAAMFPLAWLLGQTGRSEVMEVTARKPSDRAKA